MEKDYLNLVAGFCVKDFVGEREREREREKERKRTAWDEYTST